MLQVFVLFLEMVRRTCLCCSCPGKSTERIVPAALFLFLSLFSERENRVALADQVSLELSEFGMPLPTYYRLMFHKARPPSSAGANRGTLSRQVKSKTVAQCVEYYYTWKKIMRLGRRHRTRLAETIDDCMVSDAAPWRLCRLPLSSWTK